MAVILVMDDNAAIRRLIRRILAAKGHEIFEAEDGASGLAAFRDHRPDLVITDLVMPNSEGIETIRSLREIAGPVPILAISGIMPAKQLYLRIAGMLGADATLPKPFTPDELHAIVETLLERKGVAAPAPEGGNEPGR